MSSKILFVFEGEKTERDIVTSLNKFFLDSKIIIHSVYGNDIYELHKEIEKDPDLDTLLLLKSRAINKNLLSQYSKNDFSEIYLFFDYDGHDEQANDTKIESLLSVFNEETEKGKLYISYPMVEAIRHISKKQSFKTLTVSSKERNYKELVHDNSDFKYHSMNTYTRDIWLGLIHNHLRKMNFIVNDEDGISSTIISQLEIFKNQKRKYIDPLSLVAVLSSFPPMISDYYGLRKIKTWLSAY